MKNKIFADLHNHTRASDGDFTPEKMLNLAKRLGIHAIGITDHDTLKGVQPAVIAGKKMGIEVIPGVEVSVRFKRPFFTGTLHLLCYFSATRLGDENFINQVETVLSGGRGEELVKARVKEINAFFGPGSGKALLKRELKFEDIASLSDNATRRHFALALKASFGIEDPGTINLIIGNDSPAYLPSGIELAQASHLIQKTGILAVLAHPAAGSFPGKGHYKEVLPPLETVERLLPEFIKAGVKGLEVYYPGHSLEHQAILKAWAKTHHFLITGGSDCHDGTERPPGVTGISQSEYDVFKKALV